MHSHKWRLTSTSGYNTTPGVMEIYRKCTCGDVRKDTIEPSEAMISADIPIIVKSKCIFHRWKRKRDYIYCIDTSVGKIQVYGVLQQCSKCKDIRIEI
jgi:hypothetical protein